MTIKVSKGPAGVLHIECDTCHDKTVYVPPSGAATGTISAAGGASSSPTGSGKPGKPVNPGGAGAFTIFVKSPVAKTRVVVGWPQEPKIEVAEFEIVQFSSEIERALANNSQELVWNHGSNIPLIQIVDKVSMLTGSPITIEVCGGLFDSDIE